MDAATKAGQAKSNSLVFNTFIFMQVLAKRAAAQQHAHAWLRTCTLAREAEGIQAHHRVRSKASPES